MTNTHILQDGAVRLFQRANSKKWQARIKLIKGHVDIVSTGETDIDVAKRIATEKFYELQAMHRTGRDISAKRFKDVAASYMRTVTHRVRVGELSASRATRLNFMLTVSLLPELGLMRVSEITTAHINTWRENRQYKGGVKSSTLAGEIGLIRNILEHGVELGHVSKANLPTLKRPRVTYDRHPAWTLTQYANMMRDLRRYITEAPSIKDRLSREELYDYLQFMIASGIRTCEASNLRWCDITEKGNTLALYCTGKKHKGVAIARPIAKRAIERIRRRRPARLPNERIFTNVSYRKTLTNFLAKHGKQFSLDGDRYCPYSCRHTYATLMLEHKSVEIYQLSKNMRTSVQMIEQHYGHLEPVRVWKNFI